MQNIIKLSEKNKSYVLNMLLGWLFSLSVMSGLIYLTILDAGFWDMAFMTLTGILITALILYNKYSMVISAGIIGIFALYTYNSLTGEEPSYFLLERAWLLHETWLFMTGEVGFTRALNDSALWLIAICISVLSFFLLRLKFSYPLIFAIGVGVFMSANLAAPDGRHWAFFPLLMSLLLIFIKRAKNSPARVLVLAPVCALVIAFANLVPMPDVAAGRRFLEDLYEDIYWIVREPFMPRYFSSQWLGFENRDGRLGGNLNPSGDFIMWVFSEEPTYLAGVTQNIYTGYSWVSSNDIYEFTPRYEPDFSGMRNFVLESRFGTMYGGQTFMYDDEMVYSARQRRVSINIGRARTGTLFRPPNAVALSLYGDYGTLQRGMDLRVDPVLRRNATYSFTHYVVDHESEVIQDILARSRRGFYRERLEELRLGSLLSNGHRHQSATDIIASSIIESIRIPYADFVFENYTSLPYTLPERVRQHTYDIVEGYETDFERATAILNYLLALPYSLTPGTVPEGRDFVDYFLFDVREGYCTYFASAMAVMARVIGIPSRYNVGFMLPSRQAGDGFFAVYGINAHAWAELYFEGVGWIIFEATPPDFWNQPYAGSLAGSDIDWDDWWMEDYYEMEWILYMMGMGEDMQIAAGAGFAGAVQEDAGMEVNPALVVLLGIILALGSYMFIRRSEENKRHAIIRGDQYNAAVLEGFKGLVDLLEFYGFPMTLYESAVGYAKRIEKMTPLGSMQLRTSAEIFGRARYSEIEITAGDAEFIKRNYFFMYKKIQDSGNKYKFFIHRYIKKL